MRSWTHIEVQATHVTHTGDESVAIARSSNTEKVLHALNMLHSVCMLPIPYEGRTHHVRIPKFGPRFCK